MIPAAMPTQPRLAVIMFVLMVPFSSVAQRLPDIQPGIEGSVVRVFDDIGYALAVNVRWSVPLELVSAGHSVGLQAWYGVADVASAGLLGRSRELLGVGANWRMGYRFVGGRLRPYLSIPLQYVRSSIPHIDVPFPAIVTDEQPEQRLSYDLPGTSSGLAYGLGAGCEYWFAGAMGIGVGATVLRQRLYEDRSPPWVFFSFGLLYSSPR